VTRRRVITDPLVSAFESLLAGDVNLEHTVASACSELGVSPTTVRTAIERFEADQCRDDEDLALCARLSRARQRHIRRIRAAGEAQAQLGGKGTSWYTFLLETQDRKNYGRAQRLEHSGPDGAPIASVSATLDVQALLEAKRAALFGVGPDQLPAPEDD
jgi:hypothetical protein